MNAGRRDQLVQFQQRYVIIHEAADGEDEQHEFVWIKVFQQWAFADRLSETQCRFTIIYQDDIRPDTHRIIWSGAYWTITSAIPQNVYADLQIECDFSDQIEVTHLRSDVREYIDGVPVLRTRTAGPFYPAAKPRPKE